jgi:glycogen operon protein
MICGGDEIGRTQLGNNNAYCQDNEISWSHWDLSPQNRDFLEFVRYVIHLRKKNPVLKRRRFFQGRSIRGADVKDIAWFEPNGREMDDQAWGAPSINSLGVWLSGRELDEVNEEGNPLVGDTLYLMFNAHPDGINFTLPSINSDGRWERILDTAQPLWEKRYTPRDHTYRVKGRSVAVFRVVPNSAQL